jgi:hypothetical protein
MLTNPKLPATRRAARAVALAVATLSLTGCRLGWDCGTELRTTASGAVRDAANVTLATVQAEVRHEVPTRYWLSTGVMGSGGSAGAPLKGRVTRARLVAESGELIAEIPTGTSTLYVDVVVALNVELPSRSDYERVRAALLTGRAKVIIETDLAGRERLETTLTEIRDLPGEIQRCSPA